MTTAQEIPVTQVFVDLPRLLADRGVSPRGVIHVGAHHGQEVPFYNICTFERIVLVEPNPDCLDQLNALPEGVEVVSAAVGRHAGTTGLYVTPFDQQSSTRLPTFSHYTSVVKVPVLPLRDIDHEGCNVLVIDAQGCELDVLTSAELDDFDMIVVEVCHQRRYGGAPSYDDVVRYLSDDWKLAASYKHPAGAHICDLVWVRR